MRVFLSSTRLDLVEHRERVAEAIQRLGDEASRMEIFGARPGAPTLACLQEVQECDLFVGIYAHRYGYIPEGSSISITEMEYDEAARRSKPRFCYLVREDYSWPETYIDQGEAKSKLQQFRAKLQRETVRDTFTTPEDLAFKVVSALGRYLRRAVAPAPPNWDELVKRWTDEEANARATYRLQVLESREPLVQLAVVKDLWTKLLFNPPWHKEVESAIALLKADVDEDVSLETLCKDLFALDTRADYPLLRDRIARAFPANAEKNILGPQIRRLEKETGLREDEFDNEVGDSPVITKLKRLRRIRAKLRNLAEMVGTPRFCRCLLIAGGTGSGKSHVLTYLDPDLGPKPVEAGMDQATFEDPRPFLLWLRPTEDPSTLSEQVLERVREISGYPWSNLEQLDQYFIEVGKHHQAKAPKLILLVDDLHRWVAGREAYLRAFETWIARATHLACLHWVIALPATSYAELAETEHFWKAFSLLPESARDGQSKRRSDVAKSTEWTDPTTIRQVGGWLWLDEVNESKRLGQQLIREYIEIYQPEETELLSYLKQDDLASPEAGNWRRQTRHLNTPQIAWVLLDFLGEEDAQTLVNLHFIGFVERFWRKRWVVLKRESLPGRMPDEEQIRLVARALLEECVPYANRAKVIALIVRKAKQIGGAVLEDPGRVSEVLSLLAKAGLLETFEDSSPNPGRVALQVPFFWYFQVASSIFEALLADANSIAREGWLEAVADRDAREGVSEFLFLFADRELGGTDDGIRRMESFWQQAAGNPAFPDAARWLAASKASPSLQAIAVRWIQEKGWLPEEPREVFTVLVFLGEVDPSTMAPYTCLAVLQRMVAAVATAKLQDYFELVVTKVFDRVPSQEEWLRCVPHLAGCEPLGVTSTLGRLAADAAIRTCDGDSDAALQLLLRYLPNEPVRDKPTQEKKGENRVLTREWIVFHVLDRVHYLYKAGSLGPSDLLAKLQALSWYRPERLRIVPQVGGEMERDANSVLGFFYQTEREGRKKVLYEDALRALAYSSNVRDRRLAFFLILHTEPTGGKEVIIVQKIFRPLLKKISGDRDYAIQRMVADYYAVFRDSLSEAGFEEIRRQPPRRKK
ncbi:MAG TPA: DUF4062 domain-containing protein [Thermoanaerobaculia bacterium]|nr:DUF4062 domain-containing protein [Thermoanaerobaculia bacterium]